MRNATIGMLLSALLFTTACLVGRTTHTLYLDPGGEVTWTVLEEGVRSTEEETADRVREEADYAEQAWNGDQPVARALAWLGPEEMRVDVLRGERPFTVRTVARFRAVDRLAQRFLEGLGNAAVARLERDGNRTRLTITAPTNEEEYEEVESSLESLIGEASDYHILLVRGRFVEARGFTLSDEGDEAIPMEDACDTEEEICTLSLTWIEPDGDDGLPSAGRPGQRLGR